MLRGPINKQILFLLATLVFSLNNCAPISTNVNSISTDQDENSYSKPEWVPLIEGSNISYNKNYDYHPLEMKLNNEMLLRGENWDNYLKEYIESYPPNKRHQILDGITRHWHGYDKFERLIRFEPLRYISGPYFSTSYIALTGVLKPNQAQAFIKIRYYGDSWLFVQKIKVLTDDSVYQSPPLEVKRDHYRKVWEDAYLPLENPEFRQLVERIINSKETIIRFQGKQYYSDFTVPERMKTDLKAMLDAIDTINSR